MSVLDPFALQRFVAAQAPIIDIALEELRVGKKQQHWMWHIFPQLRGLGHSATAHHYGIASLDEARAYLHHPLLGARLATCTEAVLAHRTLSLHEIFGTPDDLKFRSSMTLFALAFAQDDSVFERAIDQCCGGQKEARTLALL